MAVDKDILELKRIVRNATAGKAAMDTVPSGISLTLTEQNALKYQQAPKYVKRTVAMDALPSKEKFSKGARFVVQRHDKRLTVGPVSALEYKHPGQPALDSSVVFDYESTQEQEQDAIEPDVNEMDPESYDGALSSEELEQLEVSLRAPESTTRNAAGARETGLEKANRIYAERRGLTGTRVS